MQTRGARSFAAANANSVASLWPKFALEPPQLIELSASQPKIQCRPQLFAGPNRPATPTQVRWQRAREFYSDPKRPGADEQLVALADGSLDAGAVLALEPEPEALVLRCCLSNAVGAVCSRPVRFVRPTSASDQRTGKWIGLHCALD